VPSDRIPSRANIHWIGQRPYENLPAYGKQFDVAIIPFRLTTVILHANPLKLREYLAMGKPIVTVSTPEIDRYADIAEIAISRADFLAKLDKVLARSQDAQDIARRLDRVRPEGWDARIHEVYKIVESHLKQSARPTVGELAILAE
jgi:glycosyltransferase involved in cell wall biosynthesis